MSYTQSPEITYSNLLHAKTLLDDEIHWCKESIKEAFEVERLWNGWCEVRHYDYRYCMVGAVYESGVTENIAPEFVDDEKNVRADLQRGQFPEEFWFLRQAVKLLDPENPGWIWAFNDACKTKHQDVLHVFDLALKLVHGEMLVAA